MTDFSQLSGRSAQRLVAWSALLAGLPVSGEVWRVALEGLDYDHTVAKVQEIVDGYPGLYRDLLTYLKERIKEVLTGASATVVVRLYGPDMQVLRDKAQEVNRTINDVKGVVNLKVEPQILVPHIQIRVKPDVAANFGLTPGNIRRAASTRCEAAPLP